MELVDEGYESSALPPELKASLAVTDALVTDPATVASAPGAERFSAAELAELVLTVAVAHGFSKAAIAWGPPPQLPITEVPTPSPDGAVA